MLFDCSIETRSLYIHWPFCPYRCHFCPFVALASHDQFMESYHEALKKEIEHFGASCDRKMTIDTIFLGGGTPSTYPDHLLLDMFGTLRAWFTLDPQCEISIEVNPGTVTQEKIITWKAAGINRLSMGVQSLKDGVLHEMNRLQTRNDVYNALNLARDVFDNISVDLIVGLPGVSANEWKDMIKEVVTWPIKHVSVYFLSVHENTPLYFGVKAKKITLPCDDETVDLYCWTVERLTEAGFMQYEVSNFARAGFVSRHNTAYWERKPYKGFGLGACSFDGTRRLQNQKNLMLYMKDAQGNKDLTIFEEILSREQVHLEKVMLGMRRAEGITKFELMEGLTAREREQIETQIGWLRDHNLITLHDDRVVLTPAGLAVENEIVVRLSL